MTTQTVTAADWKTAILNSLAAKCFYGQKFSDLGEEAQEVIERVYAVSCKVENLPVVEAPAPGFEGTLIEWPSAK
jgi:hypothetical protein